MSALELRPEKTKDCTDVGCKQLDGRRTVSEPLERGLGASNCQVHRFWRYSKQVLGLRGLLGSLEFRKWMCGGHWPVTPRKHELARFSLKIEIISRKAKLRSNVLRIKSSMRSKVS
jgi:hypothetical protein